MADFSATLKDLLLNFDRDTNASRAGIRELWDRDPQAFYAAAVPALQTGGDSRARQFLIALMAAANLLLPALRDPALGRDEAVALARDAVRINPMADIALARQLADAVEQSSSSGLSADTTRCLEILAGISDGTRIVPSLMRLLRHSDPHVRSKAVLMIGRSSRSVKWVQSKLAESDPRTRANAIESIWGVDAAGARELLQSAARDGNNRVAGNAMIALYRLGDSSVIPELMKIAASESAMFRATAAWVMGESCDPRFLEPLARMVAEPCEVVRRRAFSALAHIKSAVAQFRTASEWRLSARFDPATPLTGWRQVHVQVVPPDGGVSQPGLVSTQFFLSEEGDPVLLYKVEERPPVEAQAIVFLLPRKSDPPKPPWLEDVLNCLSWKRPFDLWSTIRYLTRNEIEKLPPMPPGVALDTMPDEGSLGFAAEREAAAAAVKRTPRVLECADFWCTMRYAVRQHGPARGQRRVIVLAQDDEGDPDHFGTTDLKEYIAVAQASHTSIQAISLTPNPALEELCRRTRGEFLTADSLEQAGERMVDAYLNLLARYEILYQPPSPEKRTLKIRVHAPFGWGETTIPIPPEPP